ncbi:MAG: FtsQ-type POTRA domain-containing protein [Candidatus Aquilonibacter sp.]
MNKGETARRRRASPARRLRPFWFLIAMLVALAAIGGYLFSLSHTFYPHTIDVSGNRIVSKDAILDAAQIELNRNIWLQNTGAMRQRIEAIPYIDTAAVHRHFPGAISIDVTERAPFAVIGTGSTRDVVDRTLRVLRPAGPQDAMLPLLVASAGQNTQTLCATEEAAQSAGLQATVLRFDTYGDVEMTLRGGIRVLFGDPSTVAQKVALIHPILEKVEQGKRKVVAIDLRALSTPVVVYAK